ncbi:Anaphase-promoting complex subunit 1 [Tulasnella sp. 427]|nr:Anaphase-promoting complex subunit 1 [Tulasnella sp. 427]
MDYSTIFNATYRMIFPNKITNELCIPAPNLGPPTSAGSAYVKITEPPLPKPAAPESNLLKSIRRALSATTPIPYEKPRRTLSGFFEGGEEELFWHDRTVIWSVGGVQRRKWVFETEKKDQVLWACWATFPGEKFSVRGIGTTWRAPAPSRRWKHATSSAHDDDYISTFGRYSEIRPMTSLESEWERRQPPGGNGAQQKLPTQLVRCICIFLTSFVMIYTKDGGTEYAANLPFHVKRAWPVSEGGIVMERIVAADEVEGDLLPTVFTLAGPYDEPKIAGFAHKIEGGVGPGGWKTVDGVPVPDHPVVIHKESPPDANEASKRHLDGLTKTERIVFVPSWESNPICNRIVVTHDPKTGTIRIWRYVFEREPRMSSPYTTRSPTTSHDGQPFSPSLPSAAVDAVGRNGSSPTATTIPPAAEVLKEPDLRNVLSLHQRLASVTGKPTGPGGLPQTPNQDTIATTLALAQGINRPGDPNVATTVRADGGHSRQHSGTHARVLSNSRNELSITMDRMQLTGSGEEIRDLGLANRVIDDGRMKAELWLACLKEFQVGVANSKSEEEVEACLFDVRMDFGHLAVFIPSAKTIFIFSIYGGRERKEITCQSVKSIPALSMIPIESFRAPIADLLHITPDGKLGLITYEFRTLPINLTEPTSSTPDEDDMDMEDPSIHLGALGTPGTPPLSGTKRPCRLKHSVQSAFTIVFDDNTEVRSCIDFTIHSAVGRCFAALSWVLSGDTTWDIRKRFFRRWFHAGKPTAIAESFQCFAEALMESLCQDGVGESAGTSAFVNRTASLNFIPDPWTQLAGTMSHRQLASHSSLRHLELPLGIGGSTANGGLQISLTGRVNLPRRITRPPPWAAAAMQTLHLVGESYKVSMAKHNELQLLAPLLVRVGRLVGADWSNFWAVLAPDEPDAWAPLDSYAFSKDPRLPPKPQDIFHYLATRLNNTYPSKSGHWVSIAVIGQLFNLKPALEYGPIRINATARLVLDAFMALTDFAKHSSPLDRARAAVDILHQYRAAPDDLAYLPISVLLPLREALKICQEYPFPDWDPAHYMLIDRCDLAKMASVTWGENALGYGEAYRYKLETKLKDERETIGNIVQDAKLSADGLAPGDPDASMPNREFTDVRFGIDRRLREVERMLQSSSVTTVRVLERPDLNEHDLAKEQHQFAIVIAERTMSLSLGRAMYTYGSLQSVDSDSFSIPKIDFTVRMVPHGVTITPDPAKQIVPEARAWAEFHNGVAAALRIARGTAGIDSTWIAFNRPNDLTPEHAGFILGLGLNGHLEGMYTWHTFSYLTPKHEMTTVAMLLGLAASYVGRGDTVITKMLTVHTPALLPPGSAEMNLGLWTQMAGLMGVGILYLGRKDRRMAEACLNEIGGRDFGSRLDVTNENREAYSITAALAFGMIMCGHGSHATSPADIDMISRLRILIHGHPNAADDKTFQPYFGPNLTSPAASIALGLMFMKTERTDIAGLFEIAHTPLALSRVQPNALLVRTLARLLVLWSQITPSVEWVTTQVPKKLAENEELQGYDDAIKDSYDLAYYNIVAGVCFAIALKYAGTADQTAETTLIHYYDAFSKTAGQPALTFDAQIKRSAVRDSLNLISLCVGIVMCGTGELNALRRLRYAHGQLLPYVKYGSHMTSHMSMGMLFLGGGRHTFGTSNAAIACLVAAFYPRWPSASGDTKVLLPVFRHLWSLAVEPRCLIARDADSGETVYIPIKLKIREGTSSRAYQYTSPSLIPDWSNLLAISVDSPRYWPYHIDFTNDQYTPRFAMSVFKTQTIWVKRRSGYLGYGEDPRGNRSIFAFMRFRAGDAAAMDFPNGSDDERAVVRAQLDQFITSLSVDTRITGLADWLCHQDPQSELEAKVVSYCQQSLLECLLQDKASTLQNLLSIFQVRYGTSADEMCGSGIPILMLKHLKFLVAYYGHLHNRAFGGRVGQDRTLRPPLIRMTLLDAAVNELEDRVRRLREDEQFMVVLKAYLTGQDCKTVLPQDPEEAKAVGRQLAFYLANEHVTGIQVISAFGKMAREARKTRKLGKADVQEMDEETLSKSIRMVMRSALVSGNGTPMWELTVRAFDDIVDAWGL